MNQVFEVRVVGNFHQDNPGSCTVGEQLLLCHESSNQHDPNAIVVVSLTTDLKLDILEVTKQQFWSLSA